MDPANNTPDIVLLVGALAVTKEAYSSYSWWDYWGWFGFYGCCYGPEYGLGYPKDGPGSVILAVGTLVITMLDPTRPGDEADTAPVLWAAGINGVLENSSASTAARITNLIDQAFDQSPYLSPLIPTPN